MAEKQKSVVFVQVLLSLLSISVFFIPYGDELSLSSLFYISTPFGLVLVLMLLAYQIYNVRMNSLNGPSYESSYFLNLIYVPMLFLLNLLLDFFQYAEQIIDFYLIQFLLSSLISLVVIGIALYLAFRVDQRYSLRRISRENNIKVSLTPFLYMAAITFGVFLIEGLIYLIIPDNWFLYNSFGLIDVYFHLIVAVLLILIYYLADSSVVVNIRDRLYLGVGLSTVTIIYGLYFYQFNFTVLYYDILNLNFYGFESFFNVIYLLLITLGLGFARFYVTRNIFISQKNYFAPPVQVEEVGATTENYEEIAPYIETQEPTNYKEIETENNSEYATQYNQTIQGNNPSVRGESRFTGGLLELVAVGIVQWLIIIFTLGIGTPFAIVFKLKWMNSHTYIEGRQLDFTGNALDLIFQWIKWLLLSFITLGIYGFWVGLRMHQWISKNTVFKTNN